MSNAQDLLSILGGGASARPARAGATTSGSSETSILTFKAGKMNTSLKPNGKYLVEPDLRRGELHVVWTTSGGAAAAAGGGGGGNNAAAGHLKLEWKDRRTKTVVNTIPIFPEDDATFERIETGKDGDRVYLLQCGGKENNDGRHFFWMQDKDATPDEDICVKVNLYMSDSESAATAAGSSSATGTSGGSTPAVGPGNGMDNAELLRIMQGALGSGGGINDGAGAHTTTVPGDASIPTAMPGQVDALGNILESLGMPQPNGTPAGERDAGRGEGAQAAAAAAAGGGGLTLADLQGAMAGLATASPPGAARSPPGPPLSELAAADVIDESGIMNDPDTVARLVALLPEGQRTEDMLRENIRSPQVAQCLQRLTSALVDDDAGSFNSIIANFQLDPNDGADAMASGNPIEAFLNCLLKDVEKKEGVKKVDEEEEGKEGEEGGSGDGDGEPKEKKAKGEGGEEKDDGGKDGDGDVKMDES